MKTILKFIFFVFAVLLSSCQSGKYENASLFFLKDFKIVTKLNARTVEFDEPIMFPVLFVKSDSLLIVQNIRTDKMLYVYNVNSKKKFGEFISWGSGPNDLLRIKNMQLVGTDLYITDNQKRTINMYDVNDIHKLTNNLTPTQKISIEDYMYHIAYTENGYVAITLNPDNKRLVFYNSKGEKIVTTGEFPNYGKELTSFEKMESFNSFIVTSQKYKRIYLFGMNTDLIEIYDFEGMLKKRLHGPNHFFPQSKEIRSSDGSSKIASIENSKFAFFSPQLINDEIYVSYSGNNQKRDEPTPRINHILVFDLDCNPVRRYELSTSIVSFTVDPETKLIYATCDEPDFHMVIFEQ